MEKNTILFNTAGSLALAIDYAAYCSKYPDKFISIEDEDEEKKLRINAEAFIRVEHAVVIIKEDIDLDLNIIYPNTNYYIYIYYANNIDKQPLFLISDKSEFPYTFKNRIIGGFQADENLEIKSLWDLKTNTPKGDKGDKPAHEWDGTSIRFQNPDGTWGGYVNLEGSPLTIEQKRIIDNNLIQKFFTVIPEENPTVSSFARNNKFVAFGTTGTDPKIYIFRKTPLASTAIYLGAVVCSTYSITSIDFLGDSRYLCYNASSGGSLNHKYGVIDVLSLTKKEYTFPNYHYAGGTYHIPDTNLVQISGSRNGVLIVKFEDGELITFFQDKDVSSSASPIIGNVYSAENILVVQKNDNTCMHIYAVYANEVVQLPDLPALYRGVNYIKGLFFLTQTNAMCAFELVDDNFVLVDKIEFETLLLNGSARWDAEYECIYVLAKESGEVADSLYYLDFDFLSNKFIRISKFITDHQFINFGVNHYLVDRTKKLAYMPKHQELYYYAAV